MIIFNFRGAHFANNSSSDHHLLLIPENMIGKIQDKDVGDHYYGWENFILASEETKMRYLAAQFFTTGAYLQMQNGETEFLNRFSKYLNDGELKGLVSNPSFFFGLSVDHQSTMKANIATPEIMEKFIRLFMSNRIVVFGGNDNDDEEARLPIPEGSVVLPLLDECASPLIREEGEYFVMFDRRRGTKIRWSFNENAAEYNNAKTPELVDLKITDWCDAGCKFCYQGSSTNGKHADFETIKQIVSMLKEMGVFEVAIGGGEPTKHPRFKDIITLLAEADIVPNFTTKSTDWLKDEDIVTAVKNHCGGIGVSCLSEKDLSMLSEIQKSANNKISVIQVVAQH